MSGDENELSPQDHQPTPEPAPTSDWLAAPGQDINPEEEGALPLPNIPAPWPERTPSPLDALFFLLFLFLGFLLSTAALALALHWHLWGLKDFAAAATDTRVALGTQLLLYASALAGAVPVLRTLWGKGFFTGLHWNVLTAVRRWGWLVAIAVACNLLAIASDSLLPFPKHAAIDKMFATPRDAWMLFVFGVTVAPFFEEMIFRGFLLPATASALDWCRQRLTGTGPMGTDEAGNPMFSRTAMVLAAILVSAPFAGMHAAQVNQSWGPLLLLYTVSLVLCAVRLKARSLAASTLVHAVYNFLLFSLMLLQSDGFRHLDKLQ